MKLIENSYKTYKEMTIPADGWESSKRGPAEEETAGQRERRPKPKASLATLRSVLGIPSEITLEVIINIIAHSVHSL